MLKDLQSPKSWVVGVHGRKARPLAELANCRPYFSLMNKSNPARLSSRLMRPDHALQTFDAEVDRLELNIAEVTDKVSPDHPGRVAGVATDDGRQRRRCASSACASTTPAKIQMPSAISLPDRITNAKHNLSSLTLPECRLSMRKKSWPPYTIEWLVPGGVQPSVPEDRQRQGCAQPGHPSGLRPASKADGIERAVNRREWWFSADRPAQRDVAKATALVQSRRP
jgi:hypothetical protein